MNTFLIVFGFKIKFSSPFDHNLGIFVEFCCVLSWSLSVFTYVTSVQFPISSDLHQSGFSLLLSPATPTLTCVFVISLDVSKSIHKFWFIYTLFSLPVSLALTVFCWAWFQSSVVFVPLYFSSESLYVGIFQWAAMSAFCFLTFIIKTSFCWLLFRVLKILTEFAFYYFASISWINLQTTLKLNLCF